MSFGQSTNNYGGQHNEHDQRASIEVLKEAGYFEPDATYNQMAAIDAMPARRES